MHTYTPAIVVTILFAACSPPTPAPTTVQQPPPAPVEAVAPTSAAIAKADALITEMRAREAAQAQADRVTVDAGDEATWKRRMHTLQVAFMDNIDRGNAAIQRAESARQRQDFDAVDRAIAEAERYKDAAANAQDAIDRLRDEGRRADIPPGWLRWPQ